MSWTPLSSRPAPPFTLASTKNLDRLDEPVSLEDHRGRWTVLVFYPADFTFVCPTELGDLADNYAEFKKLGVEIYGVSTDTHFTHKAWHDTSDTIRAAGRTPSCTADTAAPRSCLPRCAAGSVTRQRPACSDSRA